MKVNILNKNLSLLLGGQFISQMGDKLYAIALAFWVLEKTKSPTMMGFLVFTSMLPSVLFGFFSGSLVDRFDRKSIMVLTDIIRGVIVLGVLSAYVSEGLNIPVIMLASILLSINSALFNPSVYSILPQIVEEKVLTKANSQVQLVNGITSIIGPALGGVAVASLGYSFVFVFNAVSFFISALMEYLMEVSNAKEIGQNNNNIKEDIVEGYKYILERKRIISLLIIVVILHLFVGSIQVLLPVLATSLSGNGAANLGYIESFFGIGTVATALIFSFMSTRNKEAVFAFGGVFCIGAVFMIIGTLRSSGFDTIYPYSAAFLVLSSMMVIAGTCFQAILQKDVISTMTGRVFSVAGSLGNLSMLAATLIFGVFLKLFTQSQLFLFCGLMVMPICAALFLIYKRAAIIPTVDAH